jgi:hypothetical protein
MNAIAKVLNVPRISNTGFLGEDRSLDSVSVDITDKWVANIFSYLSALQRSANDRSWFRIIYLPDQKSKGVSTYIVDTKDVFELGKKANIHALVSDKPFVAIYNSGLKDGLFDAAVSMKYDSGGSVLIPFFTKFRSVSYRNNRWVSLQDLSDEICIDPLDLFNFYFRPCSLRTFDDETGELICYLEILIGSEGDFNRHTVSCAVGQHDTDLFNPLDVFVPKGWAEVVYCLSKFDISPKGKHKMYF